MKKRRTAAGVESMDLSRDEREKYGCIVVFSDGSARQFVGRNGLKDAAAYADARDLKIRTASTPATIFREWIPLGH